MSRLNPMTRKRRYKNNGKCSRIKHGPHFGPCLEALEDRTLLANRLDPLSNALGQALDQLDGSFRGLLSQAQAALPVLNQPLGSVGKLADTVDTFQNALVKGLRDLEDSSLAGDQAKMAIQQGLFDALTGANVLGDRDGGGKTKEDVLVEIPNGILDPNNLNVTIDVYLNGSVNVTGQTFNFGTGLP